jgi:hypothetical protein
VYHALEKVSNLRITWSTGEQLALRRGQRLPVASVAPAMSVTVSQSSQAGHHYEHTLRFQTRAKAAAAEMYSYINSNHFFSFK